MPFSGSQTACVMRLILPDVCWYHRIKSCLEALCSSDLTRIIFCYFVSLFHNDKKTYPIMSKIKGCKNVCFL